MRAKWLTAAVAATLAGAAMCANLPAAAQEPAKPATISLTGAGEVGAAPDLAMITSGVVSEGANARAALNANNEAMTRTIAALKEAGIEAKDIRTSGFSVQPQYVYPQPDKDGRRGSPHIVGYQVSNQVTAKVRDLALLGPVLDRMVGVGANQIGGITFLISNDTVLMDEARTNAMADAIRKARLYAQAAGIKLGRILSITESGGAQPVPYAARTMMKAESAAVPVEAGTRTLAVEVGVTWELVQ